MTEQANSQVAGADNGQVEVPRSAGTAFSSMPAQQTSNDLLAQLLQSARQSGHRVSFHFGGGMTDGAGQAEVPS